MPKTYYFIREKGEEFIPMITNHEVPYTNMQNALKDAREMLEEDPEIELEIVHILLEEAYPVKMKRVK